MYEVCANINDVHVKKVNLTSLFQLDLDAIENAIDGHTKMIFLCSPNNPTGNSLHYEDVEALLNNYFGLVVIDEAYINFSRQKSFVPAIKDYPGLVVLQTLSKAWGLAALRVGVALASEEIVAILNRIKPPYNINQASQELVLKALEEIGQVNNMIMELVGQRTELEMELNDLPLVEHIFPSDANFLLVKVTDPKGIYQYLLTKGIVVRDRSRVELCEGCLRITVGTKSENDQLIESLKKYNS
jgi:histidinol-phosphate aminotransferase